jgi:hypothetical protein
MRAKRVAAGSAAVVTTVLGLNLATTGPAAAAGGTWRAYGNTNPITASSSTWFCGSTVTVGSSVVAQACTVRSPSRPYVQSAAIVRNNRSSSFSASASITMFEYIPVGTWTCSSSGVAAHSWSVCFGQTRTIVSSVATYGDVNGHNIPTSAYG